MSGNQLESVKLKEIARIGDGAHASLKREDSGILYLTSKNFKQDGISLDTVDYISEETYQKYFKEKSKALTKPKENDILLSIIGTMGAPYIVKKDDVFGLSSSVSIIRPNNETIDTKYLYYWIKSPMFQSSIESIKSGVAQSFLSLPMIGSLPAKYPKELKEQKKIAKILSNYDDLIENNLKQIKLLEEKARLTYEEWFLRFRIDGQKLEIDEETGLPFGWEKDRADKFLNVKIGKTPPRGEEHWFTSDSLGCKWVSIKDMKQTSTYIYETSEEITFKGVEKHNMNVAKKGTVLLSFKLTVGETVITNEDVVTNEAIAHMNILHNDLYKEYLYLYLNNFNFDTLGSTSSIGTAINSKVVKAMPIILPCTKVLNDFKSVVVPIFEAINNLQNQNQLLKESRDILLPRFMTGMIDIENIDIEV